jgi:hypothetical protein
MMKRYWVTLNALANVQAVADVYANSAKEAEDKALEAEANGDLVWEYEGLQDGTYLIPFAQEVANGE